MVIGAALAGIAACEDKSPPPASAQSSSSKPLSGLAETPTSLPGKSAGMGRAAGQAMAQASEQAASMADQISGAPGTVAVGGVAFKTPEGWQSVSPPNRIQAAALQVAADQGHGETAVAFFTNLGGDVESNVNRWRQQVTNPTTKQPADASVTKHTAGGMKVTLVSMQGTYAGMSSGSSKPVANTGFRGAIIEAPRGNVFVRLTGPADAVSGASADFEKMVLGAAKQ